MASHPSLLLQVYCIQYMYLSIAYNAIMTMTGGGGQRKDPIFKNALFTGILLSYRLTYDVGRWHYSIVSVRDSLSLRDGETFVLKCSAFT